MKTDELITLLARDAAPVKRGAIPRSLAALALGGAVAALVIMVPWIGFRPDFPAALADPAFWMKMAYTFGLGVAGFMLAERLSRPGATSRAGWVLAAACAVAIAALAFAQLLIMPAAEAPAAVFGYSWDSCPWLIFILALPCLALALWIMRGFAPTRTSLARPPGFSPAVSPPLFTACTASKAQRHSSRCGTRSGSRLPSSQAQLPAPASCAGRHRNVLAIRTALGSAHAGHSSAPCPSHCAAARQQKRSAWAS